MARRVDRAPRVKSSLPVRSSYQQIEIFDLDLDYLIRSSPVQQFYTATAKETCTDQDEDAS